MFGKGLPANRQEVQVFYLLSGPWCFTQKSKAGFDTGIILKTPNVDTVAQLFKTISGYEVFQHHQ